MRKRFGARFMPYYRVGDFNHDGRQDFAVVLAKHTLSKKDPGLADTHRFQYELTVVVFNGLSGGGYKAVFVKNTAAPLVCFLAVSQEKKSKLYFAIYETDAGFVITPQGHGYIAEGLRVGDQNVHVIDSAPNNAMQPTAVHSMHLYEVRPRKDKRGADLISDQLPFGRLWYGEANAWSGTEKT